MTATLPRDDVRGTAAMLAYFAKAYPGISVRAVALSVMASISEPHPECPFGFNPALATSGIAK